MADKKTTKTNNKKPMSPHMKKGIRRGIAGVFLASSLLIAAIPSDRSGSASAATDSTKDIFKQINEKNGVSQSGRFYDTDGAGNFTSTEIDALPYVNDRTYANNYLATPPSGSPDLEKSSSTDPWSYTINSSKQMEHLYQYYTDTPLEYSDPQGIISGFNPAVSNTGSTLEISNRICLCYDFYTEAQYEADMNAEYFDYYFVIADPTASAYKTAKSGYTDAASGVTNAVSQYTPNQMEDLFGTEFTTIVDNYNTLRSNNPMTDGSLPTYEYCVDNLGWEEYHVLDGQTQLSDPYTKFCRSKTRRADHTISLGTDHTLVAVDIKNMESFEDPDDDTHLYIVKDNGTDYGSVTANQEHYGSKYISFDLYTKTNVLVVQYTPETKDLEKMDSNGYVYTSQRSVLAIGKHAFRNEKIPSAVTTVNLSDSIRFIGDGAFENNNFQAFSCPAVTYIGNNVFSNCKNLQSSQLRLSDQTTNIGSQAFYHCEALTNITLPASITNLGFGAFADCYALQSVVFPDKQCAIGEYAFYNDNNLGYVAFPTTQPVSLGKACFATDGARTDAALNFTFPANIIAADTINSQLRPSYTLYGADVNLWESSKVVGCADNTTEVTSGNIGSSCAYTSVLGDFLLANRKNLNTVTVNSLGLRLPMNTFMGCTAMATLTLDPTNQNIRKFLSYDANIFRDISNTDFVVNGPRFGANVFNKNDNTASGENTDYAQPRISTWATYGDAKDYIPYCFYDNEDNLHYEVGYEIEDEDSGTKEPLIFDLAVNESVATIQNCIYLGDSTELGTSESSPFIFPDEVQGYKVRNLGDNCLKDVKDLIVYLKVPDDSLYSIQTEVFKNSAKLKGVDLGNSVATIGDKAFYSSTKLEKVTIGEGISTIGVSAFEGCESLEAVYWDTPANTGTMSSIGDNAFMKISSSSSSSADPKLYFYGYAEDSSYEPFRFAMMSGRTNSDGIKICYRSSVPLDSLGMDDITGKYMDTEENFLLPTMSMMYDDVQEAVVLIDYPQIEDMPYHLKSTFLTGGASGLSDAERILLNTTRFISVPSVVTSLDVTKFLTSEEGAQNTIYLSSSKYERYCGDGSSAAATPGFNGLFNPLIVQAADDNDVHPGLFSGNATEDDNGYLSSFSPEDGSRGNDWILSVTLPNVNGIPEYTFDSCEQLQSVNIGDVCSSVGSLAFKDCNALTGIGTGVNDLNPNFVFDNYILYQNKDDGSKEINVCLPYRGSTTPAVKTETTIDGSSDANYLSQVSSIKENAFYGCVNIDTVDLSGTTLKRVIPECFDGCSQLSSVTLPESVTTIGDSAFTDCANTLTVTIPSETTRVDADAFDEYSSTKKNKVYIRTPYQSYAYGITNEPDATPENTHIYWLSYTSFIVRFFNDDRVTQIGETQTIETAGTNARIPDTGSLVSTKNADAEFAYWEWTNTKEGTTVTGSAVVEDIRQDRDIYAVYQNVTRTIRFQNDDTTEITTRIVNDGDAFPNVVNTATLTTKLHPGEESDYVFSKWLYNVAGFDPYSPVTTDVICTAYFVKAGSESSTTPTPTPSGNSASSNTTTTPTPTTAGSSSKTTGTPTPTTAGSSSKTTGTPTPTTSGNNSSSSSTKYFAIVENGSGSGQYAPGSVITITAYAPPTGRTFDRWTTSNTDIGISNAKAVSTTFVMPSHDVKVTATYTSAAASQNSANKATVPTGTTGVTPTPGGSAVPTNAGTNTTPTSNSGTEVMITTDTIDNNKKNKGYASVAGSTDNFVVKVTDSAAATAAVESALRDAYGTRFTDLRYSAFDISLYDSTGTYLVSNANDLAVTITLPIPESLLSYAGNNKAGAVINGTLQELAVQYTTIDGVPCMRFTASHFSPYTIYVDTQNIVRGVTDNTPKTGDGIAPKWFLSAGMLSVSCVLFLWQDKKKLPVEAKSAKTVKKNKR